MSKPKGHLAVKDVVMYIDIALHFIMAASCFFVAVCIMALLFKAAML